MADARFLFTTEFDGSGVNRMEQALNQLPNRLRGVTDRLLQIDNGHFSRQGEQIARALHDGLRRRLTQGEQINLGNFVADQAGIDRASAQWREAAGVIRREFGEIGHATGLTAVENSLRSQVQHMQTLLRLQEQLNTRRDQGGRLVRTEGGQRQWATAALREAAQVTGTPLPQAGLTGAAAQAANRQTYDQLLSGLRTSVDSLSRSSENLLRSYANALGVSPAQQQRRQPTNRFVDQELDDPRIQRRLLERRSDRAAATALYREMYQPSGNGAPRLQAAARGGAAEGRLQAMSDAAGGVAAEMNRLARQAAYLRESYRQGATGGAAAGGAAYREALLAAGGDRSRVAQQQAPQGAPRAFRVGWEQGWAQAADRAAASEDRLARARERAAQRNGRALEQERLAEQRRSDPTPRFIQDFQRGFRGNEDRGVGEQFGQTARLSVQYGLMYRALSAFQGVVQQVTQDFMGLEEGISQLAVVMGTTADDARVRSLAASAGETAVEYGYSSSTGVGAAAQAIGYYGLAEADPAYQRHIAQAAAESAMRMARTSGVTDDAGLRLIQRQMVGIQRSFGVPDSQVSKVEDTLTYVARQSGTSAAEMAAAVADIGTLADQAGFSISETTALLARIQTTTGGTPQSVSGSLRQVLTKADDPVIQEKLRTVGIDTSGTTLRQQLEELSERGGLSAQQERMLVQRFGRGSSDQSLSVLLRDWGEIQAQAKQADKADGAGAKAFAESMKNVSQQLQVFGRELVELGTQIARSGILAPLGVLLKILQTMTQVATAVVREFNKLPAPLREGAANVLAFGVALHALNLMLNTQMIRSVGALATRFGLLNGVMALTAGLAGRVRVAQTAGLGAALGTQGQAAARAAVAARAATAAGAGTHGVARASLAAAGAVGGVGGTAATSAAARAGMAAGTGAAMTSIASFTSMALPIILPLVAVAAAGFWLNNQAKADLEAVKETAQALLELGKRESEGSKDYGNKADEAEALRKSAAGNSGETSFWAKYGGFSARAVDTVTPDALTRRLTGGSNFEDIMDAQLQVSRAVAREAPRDSLFGKAARTAVGDRYNDPQVTQNALRNTEKWYQAQEKLSKQAEEAYAKAQKADPANQLDFSSAETLANSMKTLTDQGYSAAESLDLVSKKWADMTGEMRLSTTLDTRVRPGDEQKFAAELSGRLTDAMTERAGVLDAEAAGTGRNAQASAKELEQISKLPKDFSEQVNAAAHHRVLQMQQIAGPGGTWTPEMRQALERQVLADVQGIAGKAGATLNEHTLRAMTKAIESQTAQYATEGLDPTKFAAINSVVPQLAAQRGAEASLLAGGDPLLEQTTRMEALRQQQSAMQGAIASARDQLALMDPESAAEQEQRIQEAERHLRNFEMKVREAEQDLINVRRESLANDAQLKASTLTEDNALGRSGVQQKLLEDQLQITTNVEERKRLQAQLNELVRQRASEQVDVDAARVRSQYGRRDQRGNLQADLDEARARQGLLTRGSAEWYRSVRQIQDIEDSIQEYALNVTAASRRLGRDRRDSIGRIRDELATVREALAFARAGGDQLGALEALNQIADLQAQMRQETNAVVVSRERAHQNPGDELGNAASAIRVARHNLREAFAGSSEYWEAVAELRSAQAEMARLQRQHSANVRLLGIDLTDPVAQAQADLATARAELAAADSPWERVNAQLEVRRGENQLEQAAFQQRISDLQTNEQLGRISHSTYMEYLRAEHNRLSAIAVRTRQQQDQLNEVERLMQAAADQMSGQFNIGDIKLPTVYQVRRAVGAQIAAQQGLSAQAHANNYNSTITLNGVDFQQVVDYLNAALGGRVGTVTRRGY